MQIYHKWIAQQLGDVARSGDVWRYCHDAGVAPALGKLDD